MFIFTDIETTGLNARTDDILALGIIITRDDFTEVARPVQAEEAAIELRK